MSKQTQSWNLLAGQGVNASDLSGAQVREAGPMPNIPAVVIRHGLPLPQPPGWPLDEIKQV